MINNNYNIDNNKIIPLFNVPITMKKNFEIKSFILSFLSIFISMSLVFFIMLSELIDTIDIAIKIIDINK